jgi:hypothetical protein
MYEIPLRRRDGTLHGFALVDDEDAYLAQQRWFLHSGGYAVANIVHDGRRYSLLLHRAVMGCEPGDGKMVDHRNGKRLDCRRRNLRLATASENQQNRHAIRSATGIRGVSFHLASGLYQAHATLNGRRVAVGYRPTAEEAAALVRAWRAEHMPFSKEAERAAA